MGSRQHRRHHNVPILRTFEECQRKGCISERCFSWNAEAGKCELGRELSTAESALIYSSLKARGKSDREAQ